MTDKELKEVYALYTDLWKLFREYHEAQTDEEWEKLQVMTPNAPIFISSKEGQGGRNCKAVWDG